ncbi:unnamed protein product [Ambrosiozyma monospora]|uniref:Unnamed protein product n=1 Tax=Ambrosiozyma monospora TaxID=43982 RepID=A0ACB5T7M6_AMBMO|nr:unnamed protein product [Ambrosiozyma monospora]
MPEAHRKAIIHRMGRAWLRFCYQSGITSWVAYGSMLGWIRNGLTLPWDEDIDVIVTVDSLLTLAKNHNNSLIVDVSSQDQYAAGLGTYYLDIGPSFYSRNRGEGANAIDGRFIDTKSGMYIDLTAVAWTPDFLTNSWHIDTAMTTIVDPEFGKHNDEAEDKNDFWNEMASKVQELQDNKQLYHCRNNNPYGFEELSVMVPTFFEGVRTHMPHRYEQILRRKYPGALDRLTEPGHTYKRFLRLWVDDAECPGDDNEGEYCQDEEVKEEYLRTRSYTKRHLTIMGHSDEGITRHDEGAHDPETNELSIDLETVPMRFDEYIVEYARYLNARLE